jgi:imidazole glycerol-phosphate synthase subunit HisH
VGNLRSVAQAVMHVATGTVDHMDVVVTADAAGGAPGPARRAARPGRTCPTAWPSCNARACARRCLDAAANKPLFGVCVGMQMLLAPQRRGRHDGLGLVPGEVVRFRLEGRLQPDGSRYKVPQMGWNRVFHELGRGPSHPMWAGIPDGSYWFYFVHSYYARPHHAVHIAWAKPTMATALQLCHGAR